jgi:hypothetical protein
MAAPARLAACRRHPAAPSCVTVARHRSRAPRPLSRRLRAARAGGSDTDGGVAAARAASSSVPSLSPPLPLLRTRVSSEPPPQQPPPQSVMLSWVEQLRRAGALVPTAELVSGTNGSKVRRRRASMLRAHDAMTMAPLWALFNARARALTLTLPAVRAGARVRP